MAVNVNCNSLSRIIPEIIGLDIVDDCSALSFEPSFIWNVVTIKNLWFHAELFRISSCNNRSIYSSSFSYALKLKLHVTINCLLSRSKILGVCFYKLSRNILKLTWRSLLPIVDVATHDNFLHLETKPFLLIVTLLYHRLMLQLKRGDVACKL